MSHWNHRVFIDEKGVFSIREAYYTSESNQEKEKAEDEAIEKFKTNSLSYEELEELLDATPKLNEKERKKQLKKQLEEETIVEFWAPPEELRGFGGFKEFLQTFNWLKKAINLTKMGTLPVLKIVEHGDGTAHTEPITLEEAQAIWEAHKEE